MILQLEPGACRGSQPTVGWPSDLLIQLGLWAETDVLIQNRREMKYGCEQQIYLKSFPQLPSEPQSTETSPLGGKKNG